MNSRRTQIIIVSIAGLLIVGGLLARSILYTVNERELVVVLQFGRPVVSRTEPGLYAKLPLIQEVRRLPRTLQFWRSSQSEMLVDLPTADGKKIEVSAWAIWRITDPDRFVQVLKTIDNAETAVNLRVRAAIRDVVTSHKLSEVVRSTDRKLTYSFQVVLPEEEQRNVGDGQFAQPPLPEEVIMPGEVEKLTIGREKIMEQIKEKVVQQLKGNEDGEAAGRGIELVDVGISNIGFVPAVREAAFERLKAFMESIASGYYNAGVQRKQEILNQTQAEVEKILGEGEEQSNILRGEVDAEIIERYAQVMQETGDFYNFIRTLEVYEKGFGKKTRLILTTDSDLFRLLKRVELGPSEMPQPSLTDETAQQMP